MANVHDVARQPGAPSCTTALGLNGSTPQKRSRLLNRSRTVAMLIPDLSNPFFARVVRGAEDRLARAGYSLVLCSTHNDPAEQNRYLQVFATRQTDGLLVFLAVGGDEDVAKVVQGSKPVVLVGRTTRQFPCDAIAADNRKGTSLAIDYLVRRGHSRIALLVGQPSLSISADRVAAWKQCMKRAGLDAPNKLIGAGDWTHDSGRRLALEMLSRPGRPTAFFASNFLIMTGVLAALKEIGLRCPADVEIVSAGDWEWLDVFDPPISTVVQPSYDMGEQAAELLLRRIAYPDAPIETRILAPALNVRDYGTLTPGTA